MPEKSICFVYNTSQYLFLHRFDLMETMVKNGFMIYAIAPRDEYSEKIKGTNIHFIEINIDRKGYNPLNDLLFFYRLLKIYLRIRPQIVHHFTIKPIVYGSICARLLNIPKIINSINGLGYLLLNKGVKAIFAKYIYKVSIDKDNIINIFQNKDDMHHFISNKFCKQPTAHLVRGCGVNLDYFKPSPKNKLWFKKKIRFLFLSRMLKDKGLIELVNATKKLYENIKDFELILTGSPDNGNPETVSEEWLVNISSHPAIKWVGFVKDSRKMIDDCHVMILPSYREGLSQSLLEGIAMGMPIITTDVPGCRELIDGNGFLVEAKNKDDLCESMEEMLLNKDLLSKMSKKSIQISKNFRTSKINDQLLFLYN